MDQELLQQANYARAIITLFLSKGSKIWNFANYYPVKTEVNYNGKLLDSDELGEYAIQSKRKGEYASAIGAYMHIMIACEKETGKIPVVYARGLFKVLVSANFFQLAFGLVTTICADMEHCFNVNPTERQLFNKYFSQMRTLAIEAMDNNDFTYAKTVAADYSGSSYSYTLCRSYSEIRDDLEWIREEIRKHEGV